MAAMKISEIQGKYGSCKRFPKFLLFLSWKSGFSCIEIYFRMSHVHPKLFQCVTRSSEILSDTQKILVWRVEVSVNFKSGGHENQWNSRRIWKFEKKIKFLTMKKCILLHPNSSQNASCNTPNCLNVLSEVRRYFQIPTKYFFDA